jgi:eukaryotic-like serine/threonine-protein kinase
MEFVVPWRGTGVLRKRVEMIDRVVRQLGNYRLVRLLGEGGFAQVYLGEHVYLKTYAAIKVLQTQLASHKQEAFLAEARSIARLKHVNIVRVLEFGVENNTPFLVMDYAPNGSLRQHHPIGTRLPTVEVLPYVKQVAAALQYAHNHNLIHRDVKPENMLLGTRNQLLLSDFGIAQVVQSTHDQNSQEIVGTITYMAPEQLQDKSLPASDQYALGAVVYEWLTGDCPFHGSFVEIASQHLFVPPPPLHEKIAEIPLAVEETVMTALAKDPQERFPGVQEFATALEQAYLTGQRTAVVLSPGSSPSLALLPNAQTDSAAQPSSNLPQSSQPSSPPPTQQEPRYLRLTVGKVILFIMVLLLAMASSSGLTYYATVLRPAQLQAQTTLSAQAKQAQATAQAMTALQNIYTQATSGKPALQSSLRTNDANQWLEFDSTTFGSCTFKGGAYHASTVLGSQYDFCGAISSQANFRNCAFQVEMTIIRGDMGGISLRQGGYSFFIGQDGSYVFTVYESATRQRTLLNGFSSAIKTGLNQTNLIAVIARGISFYLYVNKQYVAYVNDSTFTSGGSIGVATLNGKHATEAIFRNAQVWNLA